MNSNNQIKKRKYIVVTLSVLLIATVSIGFAACKKGKEIAGQQAEDVLEESAEDNKEHDNQNDSSLYGSEQIEDVSQPEIPSYSEEDMVDFDEERAFEYGDNPSCRISDSCDNLVYSINFALGIPRSDDNQVYLFEIATYEDEDLTEKRPVAKGDKDWIAEIEVPYKEKYLFARFVPALLVNGEYIPIAKGQYITNPEALADNTEEYPQIESKKGLLLDANTLGSEKLSDLNVKRIVFNIPLSYIMGESDNPECPTIEYEYNGKTYYFDGYRCAGFDNMFASLTEEGYYCSAIILNDWNKKFPEIIHPMSKPKIWKSKYYAFNTEEEDGVRLMEATALFLADRYNGGDYGMVYDWIIANEINQHSIWHYMNTDDIDYFTESFEKSFRTFYNAIKSRSRNSRICFSIDHDWNNNNGYNGSYFNGRDLLYSFNERAKAGGNYDWGLSVHPYPAPLTKTAFWKGEFDKSEDSKVVTPMNLSALTEVMTKEDFLDTNGKVRDISITELGFSSRSGEQLQAAAFAYCYYIIDNNEYISSFLLNRQTDDTESLKSGLALGIYNNDYSEKYIAEVFANIDSKKGEDYIQEMLDIIGAESLEEALKKAE